MLYYGKVFKSRELKIITGLLITQVAIFSSTTCFA